jgi:hypothetical protein
VKKKNISGRAKHHSPLFPLKVKLCVSIGSCHKSIQPQVDSALLYILRYKLINLNVCTCHIVFLFWKCVQNDKWEITSFPRLEKSAVLRYVWQVKIETSCLGSVKSNYSTTARCHNLIVNVDYIMKAINIEKWSIGNCFKTVNTFVYFFQWRSIILWKAFIYKSLLWIKKWNIGYTQKIIMFEFFKLILIKNILKW